MKRPSYTKPEKLLAALLDALDNHPGCDLEAAKANAVAYMAERKQKLIADSEKQAQELMDSVFGPSTGEK